VALLRVGFNEGSLLRRTLLHVGTFVVGSVAFIGLLSFVLVSVVKGLLPHEGAPADAVADQQGDESGKPGKPSAVKPSRKPPPGSTSKDD
jgi:hypothetical protein